ncbi:hypothetical protein HPB52_005814 [Rhipicephalus sanguineus]|uniref:THAP-type domain-containing protein n=1 Tax=Rhipicephalus sanguineus TaxID=34632 RepID=A0A9D4QC78_RHISA|nr:hypothetical protein HPB52_005814 [Rhipicephalus sanguineus]
MRVPVRYRKNPKKRHLSPPSDPLFLQKWERSIPHADKTLGKTCKVCDVHLQESDILKIYDAQDSLPSETLLVLEREYVSGSLVYPSKTLFECVRSVEYVISQE